MTYSITAKARQPLVDGTFRVVSDFLRYGRVVGEFTSEQGITYDVRAKGKPRAERFDVVAETARFVVDVKPTRSAFYRRCFVGPTGNTILDQLGADIQAA